jgi:hypothetical protein
MSETKKVYTAISAVQAALAEKGLSKFRRNEVQNFNFRGIDDVYNVTATLLPKHGLVILPRYTERSVTEKASKNGGILFCVLVKGYFDFVAVEDGSTHTVETFGEAQDSGDKATNKAMAAAHKYALLQTFTVPTEGDNDADASSPEPVIMGEKDAESMIRSIREAVSTADLNVISDRIMGTIMPVALTGKVQAAFVARKKELSGGSK